MGGNKILGALGLVAYLVVGVIPYLVSGLVVPGWAYILLWVVWVVGFIFAIRTFRKKPVWTLAFAPAAVAFWFAYVSLGSWAFGWTA